MSALFTPSTSQSQLQFDSHSNGEINTNSNLRRISPMSSPLQIMDNNGMFYKKFIFFL